MKFARRVAKNYITKKARRLHITTTMLTILANKLVSVKIVTCSRNEFFVSAHETSFTKRVFSFAHEKSFWALLTKRVLTKRVLTKRVFELCSRNECSRNQFETRGQINLKVIFFRWKFQLSTCSPSINIVHMRNSQCSTKIMNWLFVLIFSDVVTGDAQPKALV